MTTPYVGQITMFAGNFAISGWAFCNGQTMSISQNTALFSLLGTTYGGDGVSTFMLPNLQSRVAVGQGNGQGLSPYVLGQAAGTEGIALSVQQMPSHTHGFFASTTLAVSGGQAPSSAVVPGKPTPANSHLYAVNDGTTPPPVAHTLTAGSCGQSGANQQHSNLMPSLCVTYIIALVGLYPSRS
jgi:microcystin-dependent protein